ncbi:MAG: hypothetical protein JW888_06100 [Pirellulales bacterium]|nr:hypothetical protein [Pirellulales bacterium]
MNSTAATTAFVDRENLFAERFAGYTTAMRNEMPDRSIVYHVDQGNLLKTRDVLGEKFCLSGGLPNTFLSCGSAENVRRRVKEILDMVAGNGGHIMDASAIIQNDATVENIRAMTKPTREHGVYGRGHSSTPPTPGGPRPTSSSFHDDEAWNSSRAVLSIQQYRSKPTWGGTEWSL